MPPIITERDGPVLRVTLNRPEVRNAFDEEVVAAISSLAATAAQDNHLRAVVIAGNGKAFCAGADIAWMAKSIAWLVHSDGTRVKLDDYKHKNLYLIVGAIASRLHPDQWTPEAKPVKAEQEAAEAVDNEGIGDDEGPQLADDESLAEVPRPANKD